MLYYLCVMRFLVEDEPVKVNTALIEAHHESWFPFILI
jgi:hypothetical protein